MLPSCKINFFLLLLFLFFWWLWLSSFLPVCLTAEVRRPSKVSYQPCISCCFLSSVFYYFSNNFAGHTIRQVIGWKYHSSMMLMRTLNPT